MNTQMKKMLTGCLALVLATSTFAETITLTAQTDQPILLAGEKQIVYLRVGLTGCPLEKIERRAPLNVAIVIDKSGSMSGEKIRKAKEAAIMAVRRLKPSDIVSVVLYDSNVEVLVPATKLTRPEDVIRKIRSVGSGGSTALYAGVKRGAEEVRKFLTEQRVNRVVLLSDGLANVGPDSPCALGNLGAELAGEHSISVTTIGLGLGYNEDLMTQLASRSDGGHYFAEQACELASIFDQEFDRALSVVAQDAHIEIICGEGMRPVRILGREGEINGRNVTLDIHNIYSEHEKYVLLEVEIPAHEMDRKRELANVRVTYKEMQTTKTRKATSTCHIKFSDSKELVEKNLNKTVRADAVEQIAIENNKRALELRDKGQVEEAKGLLKDNADYLRSSSQVLNSPKLGSYATENEEDASNLDEVNWGRQRKVMRESQEAKSKQR